MITDMKLIVVHVILRYGYNALFSDVDLVFIHDPWPHLATKIIIQQCDYTFQPNNVEFTHVGLEGNDYSI